MKKVSSLLSSFLILLGLSNALLGNPVEYSASGKDKKGKHIVLIASDHEYRAEETIPALPVFLRCITESTAPYYSDVDQRWRNSRQEYQIFPVWKLLKKADGMVIFTRFLALPPEQMKHIDDYLNRAGPGCWASNIHPWFQL